VKTLKTVVVRLARETKARTVGTFHQK